MKRSMAAAAALAALAVAAAPAAMAAASGPAPPQNPATGPNGSASMHGDSESSDTTPYPGPGSATVNARYVPLAAACPLILVGTDGYPVALCTAIADRTPTVYLLDPATGAPLASLRLTKGNLLGGVYGYLDNADRLVVATADNNLVRISHTQSPVGVWSLAITQSIPLGPAFTRACGNPTCDGVVSESPDWQGRVWFATTGALVGYADPASGRVEMTPLGVGEHVDNSISTAPAGTAVTTDHALYLLRADRTRGLRVVWRRAYDRGPARKPGQLSWGSGATPTFFGPRTGAELLAITDNAVPLEHLLVYSASTGKPVCDVPTVSGTENSPIGYADSVYVAGTYGYPYPALPADAGPSQPASAPFAGGITRVDMTPGGCRVVWNAPVRSSAVPRLSRGDHLIYTMTREQAQGGAGSSSADLYRYTVVDPATGATRTSQLVGVGPGYDTLQMVGSISRDRVLYQGTLTGILRVAALP